MKASINNSLEYLFEDNLDWDCVEIKDNQFHIIYKNKSFVADIVTVDSSHKTVELLIHNRLYTVVIQDHYDLLLNQLGMAVDSSKKDDEIKAPMPGRILDILVSSGDDVSQGENVIVLEAMKMENIIKSPRQGTIKSIGIQKGQSVEKNMVLLAFE